MLYFYGYIDGFIRGELFNKTGQLACHPPPQQIAGANTGDNEYLDISANKKIFLWGWVFHCI